MTGLDLINKIQKDLWNNSVKLFDSSFDEMFMNLSKVQSFPFYNVVKYGKGEYGIELGLAGFNKKNVKVSFQDGVLTVKLGVNEPEEIKAKDIEIK